MSNSFRIEASEVQTWHAALAQRMDIRGVPAIAKELEAHLAKKDPDGSVVISRHQLFTWAEALQGAASRSIQGAPIEQIVADMRGILGGKPADPSRTMPVPGAVLGKIGPAPGQEVRVSEPSRLAYTPPASVVYGATTGSTASTGGGAGALLAGAQLADTARDLIRSARTDLFVSSPWDTGIETILADIIALPPNVRVMIVSRRPAQDTPAFHQAMDQLGRRRAVTAFSPHIQTRMIVQDDTRALVGAASVPGPASREAALLLSDRASVAAVRAHFERVHAEAAGPR